MPANIAFYSFDNVTNSQQKIYCFKNLSNFNKAHSRRHFLFLNRPHNFAPHRNPTSKINPIYISSSGTSKKPFTWSCIVSEHTSHLANITSFISLRCTPLLSLPTQARKAHGSPLPQPVSSKKFLQSPLEGATVLKTNRALLLRRQRLCRF